MTTEQLLDFAKWAAGVVGIGVPVIAALVNILPNRITALTAARQQRDDENRKQRQELREERNRLQKECEEMERERDFLREQIQQLRERFVDYRAVCIAQGKPCGQDVPPIKIPPYTPSSSAPSPDPSKPASQPAGEKGA